MLQAYVFSALSVLALHATLDASTSLFVRSRKHPWTPHPALLFLGGTQTVLAALYATPRATPPDVARPRAKVVASLCVFLFAFSSRTHLLCHSPPPPRARPPIQIQNALANAKNTYGRHVSWSSLLPPFVSFVRSQLSFFYFFVFLLCLVRGFVSRVAMTIALPSHPQRCAGAGAVGAQLPCPRRGHAFCLPHRYTRRRHAFCTQRC
jgi:hypothetical protein